MHAQYSVDEAPLTLNTPATPFVPKAEAKKQQGGNLKTAAKIAHKLPDDDSDNDVVQVKPRPKPVRRSLADNVKAKASGNSTDGDDANAKVDKADKTRMDKAKVKADKAQAKADKAKAKAKAGKDRAKADAKADKAKAKGVADTDIDEFSIDHNFPGHGYVDSDEEDGEAQAAKASPEKRGVRMTSTVSLRCVVPHSNDSIGTVSCQGRGGRGHRFQEA